MKNWLLLTLIILVFFLQIGLVSGALGDYTGNHFDTSGQGNDPHGITCNGTDLFTIDLGQQEVYRYNLSGTYLDSFDTSTETLGGGGMYGCGNNLTNIFITDATYDKIHIYSMTGVYAYSVNVSDNLPSGMGGDSDENYFWVSDNFLDIVVQFDMAWNYISNFSIAGQTLTNYGMTVAGDYLWVSETTYKEVFQYYKNGTYTGFSFDTSIINAPTGIGACAGYFYVVDPVSDEVYIYEGVPILDTTFPEIYLTTPLNNIHSSNTWQNYSVNITDNQEIDNATLYIYNDSGLVNSTFQEIANVTNILLGIEVNLSDGEYTWFYKSADINNNVNTSLNRTIYIDTNPPILNWFNPSYNQNPYVTNPSFIINASFYDPYLDAVNITIINASGNEIYNNISENLTDTEFWIYELVTLDEGENFLELCARDSLTSSPKIRDIITLNRYNINPKDEYFDLVLDNGVEIRRTTYIINNGGQKIKKQDYNLLITDTWDSEGKHLKTDIISDKLLNQNWAIRIDFECLSGCDYMLYLNDRGKERIIDNKRNLYFNYDDAVADGWNVQYSQQNKKASVVISYPDLTFYNLQPSRHTIDPIVAGLNTLCDNQTITLDTYAPVFTITYPLDSYTYNVPVTDLKYIYVDDNPDSCWFSTNGGETNSSRVNVGTNFTGLTSVEGHNTWTLYCNDSAGYEGSDTILFRRSPAGTILCPADTGLCNILDSSGAGLNIFINYIAIPLGIVISAMTIVFIMVMIGYAIARIISRIIFKIF